MFLVAFVMNAFTELLNKLSQFVAVKINESVHKQVVQWQWCETCSFFDTGPKIEVF